MSNNSQKIENQNRNSEFYPLAVIGMSCYLPDASSPAEFWSNLFQGHVSIRPVGEERFSSVYYNPKKGMVGRSYTNLAALVDYDHFCHDIVPKMESEFRANGRTDPLFPSAPGHLLALYTALETFRSAHLDPFHLTDPSVGVFTGLVSANNSDEFKPVYPHVECFLDSLEELPEFASFSAGEIRSIRDEFLKQHDEPADYVMRRQEFLSEELPHQLIRLIQKSFGLTGAGFSFDSACSSSLLSLELARNYLREGKISAALVGGMTFFETSGPIYYSNASSCSSKGAWPFDKRASGLVSGEGCVFSLIKGLRQAIADGDEILGIVRGVGISSDGRGKSLWAPSSGGQQLAIERAFRDSGMASWDGVDYVEAHATSTSLGDATELTSLQRAMAGKVCSEKRFPVTSVKSNIGHILEAAGMASMVKVLLGMENETILHQTGFESTGDNFDWEHSPFYVPTEDIAWPVSDRPRVAVVEAFGIGGLNAQVVVEGPEGKDDVLLHTPESEGEKVPIAIVGAGCVLPEAFDTASFRKLLDAGKPVFSPIPKERTDNLFSKAQRQQADSLYHRFRGGFVSGYEYNWRRHRIPPKHVQFANPLQFMILGAVDEAIESGGYHSHLDKTSPKNTDGSEMKALDSETTAVVVGTRTDSDFLRCLKMVVHLPVFERRLRDVLKKHSLSQEQADQAVEAFRNRIYQEYPCLKDETGSYTISTLASRITKTYDLMGGGITLDSGDTSSLAALENGVHLLRHHAHLKTVVCAAGHRSMTMPELERCEHKGRRAAEGAVAFLLKRLDDAQRDKDSILAVIRDVESVRLTNQDGRKIDEIVAGLAERVDHSNRSVFLETVDGDSSDWGKHLSEKLEKTWIAANRTIAQDGEESNCRSVRSLLGDLRPVAGAASVLRAVLQMEKAPAGDNPIAVVSQIDEDGIFYQVTMERTCVPKASQSTDLSVSKTLKTPFVQNNSSAEKSPDEGKIVFLLPGQGSQYKGMLQPFLREVPESASVLREIDRILNGLSFPTFDDLAVQNADQLGKDVFRTQISLLAADVLIARTLEECGIFPDMTIGHSYGEYPAMVAAGIWPFETAARMTERRCRVICQSLVNAEDSGRCTTGMLSTNAQVDEIAEVFRRVMPIVGEGTLFVSNRNSMDQTVISGTRDALERLAAELKRIKRAAILLSVPAAYHSPLVADVCRPLEKALEDIRFSVPAIPFLSSVSMRFEADPDVFRTNLVTQMTRPVDFVEIIRKAYREGGRYFIEVGPKNVLGRLASKILADKTDAHYYHCDNGPKGTDRPLNFAQVLSELKRVRDVRDADARRGLIRLSGSDRSPEPKPVSPAVAEISTVSAPKPAAKNQSATDCRSVSGKTGNLPSFAGSAWEVGFARGQADADRIRRMLRRYADIAGTPAEKLLTPFAPVTPEEAMTLFGQDGYEELLGMAEGAQVLPESLIRHNLSVFPQSRDHISKLMGNRAQEGCSHFAGFLGNGEFVHGGNIDIAFSRIIPNALYSEPVVRRLEGNIPSVSIVLTGLLGSRGGFNARGLVVTTCDLMDRDYVTPPANGLHRGIVLQTILDRCATPQEAVEFLRRNHFGGAKAIGLSDLTSERTWLVEYCGGDVRVSESASFFGTNHARLLQTRNGESGVPVHSAVRFQRLAELLQPDADGRFAPDSGTVFSILRDTYDSSVKSDSERNRYRTMNMILQATNAFSWMIFHDKEILRFQRTESPVLIPGQDGVCEEYRLRDILPEFNVVSKSSVLPAASVSTKHSSRKMVSQPAGDRFISAEELIKAVEVCPKSEEKIQGQPRLTERFCDRLVRLQPLSETGKLPTMPILMIHETENPLADVLRKQIVEKGGRAVSFSVRTANGTIKSCEQIQKEIDSLYDSEAFYDVLILSSWNHAAPVQPTEKTWHGFREETVVGPTLAVQQWYRRICSDQKIASCHILAATRMGGDLGVNGKGAFPEDGVFLGLLRSIRFETYIMAHSAMKTAIVDHAPDESCETVAEDLLRELGSDRDFLDDVGYLNGERVAVRMIGRAIEPKVSPGETLLEPTGKRPVWLITGGCRGVTAELALGIGKHYGAKLHLIGSTELTGDPEWVDLDAGGLKKLKQSLVRQALERKQKPADVWANVEKMIEIRHNLRRFAENQIEVVYHSCDLSDYENAYEITSKILQSEEKIDAVLFGAGYERASLFEKLSENVLRKTFDVKVTSAAAILSALGSRSPSKIIGMGSIAGRVGSCGQASYCLANVALGKLLTNFTKTHPQCRSLLINWPAWGEVGMAIRPESRGAIESSGMNFMPLAEGVRVFLDELDDGQREPEICRAAWRYYQWVHREVIPVFSDSALAELPRAKSRVSNLIPQTQNTNREGAEGQKTVGDSETSVIIGESDYLRGNSIEEILAQPRVSDETSRDSTARVGRFVPRLMETELLPTASDVFSWKELFDGGAVLTLGDGSVAKNLVKQLESAGLTVWRIVPTEVDQTEKLLSEFWNRCPFVTVIDLTNDDPEPANLSDETWEKQMKPRLMLAYRVIRQTVILARASKYFSKLNFMAGIRMGGHFGLTGQDGFPSGGVSSGLLKALRDEIRVKEGVYLPVKVVDHSLQASPDEIVGHLLSELKAEREAISAGETLQETLIHPQAIHQPLVGDWSPFDLETGYFEGHRYVVRTIGLPRIETERSRSAWFCSLAESEPKSGVWVLVGGLRGITNANAFRLAQELHPRKIWLVGSSPFEPVEEKYLRMSEKELAVFRSEMTRESLRQKQSPIKHWNAFNRRLEMTRNQRRFLELGTDIEYRPCDTRSWKNIETLIQEIESAGDSITGLVFGAVWPNPDQAIDKTNIQDQENGLMTKTCGLTAFLDNLKEHPLRFVVGFGSVSGRFGGNGEICYTSQNDMSAKLIHVWNHRKPNCRFFCVQWGAWGDVGVASRPENRGICEAEESSFFTVQTGVPFFMGEFYAGLPESDVLFVSWDYYDRFQPNGISLPKRLKSSEKCSCDCFEAGTSKKSCPYIEGINSESRLIREKLGLPEETDDEPTDERLQNAAVFVFASPRDPALTKVDCRVRSFRRNERQKEVMRLFARWLSLRKAVSSDVSQSDQVLLLTFSDVENPIGYDEAQEYRETIERCLGAIPVSHRPILTTLASSITEKPDTFVERVLRCFDSGTVAETATDSQINDPLLTDFVRNSSDRSVSAVVTVDPSRDPFLVHHQLKGKSLLPFVLEAEIFAQTARKNFKDTFGKDGRFIELRDLKSIRGMVCSESAPYRLVVHGCEADDGFLVMRLAGDYYNSNGKKINENCPYFSGQAHFSLTGTLQVNPCPNISAAKSKWTPEYPGPNPDGFYHGPILQKLRDCYFVDPNKMVGDLIVPDRQELIGRDKPESFVLDAAILDAAFWACGVLNWFNHPGHSVIPDTLECLRGEIGCLRPGSTAQVAVELVERVDLPLGYSQVVFRFVIYDATGKPVWSAERFRMTELQVRFRQTDFLVDKKIGETMTNKQQFSHHFKDKPMIDLTGKTALITGSSRGIGRATAIRLAEAGADIVVNYVTSKGAANETAEKIAALGRNAYLVRADVSQKEDVDAMVEFINREIGRLDIIVSNAATGGFRPLLSATRANFDAAFSTNVLPMILLAQAARHLLEKASGRAKIVGLSSHGSFKAIPWYGLIGASKAALEAIVRHLTLELGEKVNVNVVLAGLVDTDSGRKLPHADEMFASIVEHSMVGNRTLKAEDVANAILFLVSPLADMVQGTTLVVDGGSGIHC